MEEKLHEGVGTVEDFPYLGDKIYSVGVCKAVVTSRTRLGWSKFSDCQGVLCGQNFFCKQRNCIQKLCEISNALWKRYMVPRSE